MSDFHHAIARIVAPICCFALLAFAPPFAVGQSATLPQRGAVIAANGKPAAGALVWAAKLDWDNRMLQRREAVADAEGKFALDLDAGEWHVWGRMGNQGGEGHVAH